MAKYANIFASVAFILFAGACMAASLRLPLGTPLEPMPGFLPLIVSIFLLFVSLLQLAQTFRGMAKPVEPMGEHWMPPVVIIAGLLIYSAALELVGYIVATTGLSFLIMRMFESRAWLKSIVIAASLSVLSYILFDRLLEVRLPPGLLKGLL
ncbi:MULTISPECIES: tripartite tricarboxylate transporter TctB family protein [unclassified Sinorhizobium]|uniref:tripartite tricarboxylate transporter TctB family protein n=1 Tax=unclassified Sinorhizobium TaxID=2613772 RepID=UPI0035266031